MVSFLTGCTFLAGLDKAKEAYTQTQADAADAKAKYDALAEQLNDIKAAYDDAVAKGDTTKAAALIDAGQKAFAQWQAAKDAYDSTAKAYVNAAQRLKDSQSTSDYLGNIFGIVLGAVGGILGGGTGVGAVIGKQLTTLSSAVKKTADNVDTHVPDANWAAFTKDQSASMTPAEKLAFNKAAGLA
jgi:hypothetical protein